MMSPTMMGTGYWGANQGCSYQQRPAQAMSSESDEIQELRLEISELKQEISEKKSEKKKFDRELKRAKSDITNNLSEEYAEVLMAHMDSSRRCSEYVSEPQNDNQEPAVTGDIDESGLEFSDDESSEMAESDRPAPPQGKGMRPPRRQRSESRGANDNMLPVQVFTSAEWKKYCDAGRAGAVLTSVCDNSTYRANGSRARTSTCKSAIASYRTNSIQSTKIQSDIEDLNHQIERLQEDIQDARQDESTEGTVCTECMAKNNNYNYQQPQSNTASLVANVVTGAASMYAGYKTNQMVTDANANLGYPTQASFGYPYMMQGMYGALSSGSGQGGFGCGNSMMGGQGMMGAMNGMTGMNSMYGMMSGGIYTGMGSPYGMNGMSGMNSMMGLNPSMMYGMNGMNGMNSMYGMSGMNSQYSAMASMQQQMAMLNYQMSMMQSYSGVYGNTGLYNTGSTYISPTGLTTATTTLPGGVIMGSTSSGYTLPSSYLNTYTSPYTNTYNSGITIPGVVPAPTSSTTLTGTSVIMGTGR
ncbi:hypothetical protein [Bdellovibrio sp. GT3]|uniref:hypothetical protein n=1 Tax=Bdellovibrio sp. GT3 TaxID=3136282 RepID=UPI0030F01B25